MKKTALLIAAVLCAVAATSQTAVGRWRDCIDLTASFHVAVGGDQVWYAARNGISRFDRTDRTVRTFSRATGLSDVGIAAMACDSLAQYLVVAYGNANIDILYRGRIYNLSDIKRTDLTSNKDIYNVRLHDGRAYLATGFGVVVVDLARREIEETWYLGTGGGYLAVYDIAFVGDSIYAATANGILRADTAEQHLGIADRWLPDSRLASTTVTRLASHGGRLVAAGYTIDPELFDVYYLDAAGYHPLCTGRLKALHTGGHRLAVSIDNTVVAYDTAFVQTGTYTSYSWGALNPNDAVFDDEGTLWVAHPWDALVGLAPDGSDEVHSIDSPSSGDNVYHLVPFGSRMLLCPGGHTTTFSNSFVDANLFTAVGRHWYGLDRGNGMLDGLYDVVGAAVNPRDTTETVAAIWGTGIVSIRDNKVQRLYDESSTGGALRPYVVGSYSSLRTGSVVFDNRGNLWTTVSHTDHALAVRRSDGTWQSFSTAVLSSMLHLDKIVWDSVRNYLWLAGHDNAVYVHDGDSRLVRIDPNSGSKLQTEAVNAIVQDRNGNIWIGTNKGIKVIYDGYNAFKRGGNGETAPVTCSNITMSNGEFAEYLMAYENITAIAVDGANRKWVGTASGGLYLISANGLEQLQHFTTTNSPLFSDKVVTVAIQPRTGEVYVGTDRGLQVYRSTATYAGDEPQEQVYAFPNPVRPGYDGPIAIKGFTRDALVHITDAAGHTVYSTQALGGQAVWYGLTASGEPVASGVYYVFASDIDGGNRSVAKILVIR